VFSPLEHRFPDELAILEQLFGRVRVQRSLPRLNEVSEYTERKWLEYVQRVPDGLINYLLIAEAPPETADDPPLYFLDPVARPRTLMQEVSKAFFNDLAYKRLGAERTLTELARRGFLMVDSIPFAMKYSTHRSRRTYAQLVGLTAKSYMQMKLTSPSLLWSKDLRIAFSVPRNARCVIRALQHQLQLEGKSFALSEDMIAVDGSHYPRDSVIRAIFQLSGR
jgi:hypothetical protein